MIKANSLLYAIYICLIVSIICGALLYFANLYSQLNLYYNLQEELYLQNQSLVNYALGNKLVQEELQPEENSGIIGNYTCKQYGLLKLLLAQSSIRKDTVSSAHFVGNYTIEKEALYLSNFTQKLSFSGKVKLNGDIQIPTNYIDPSYVLNQLNQLTHVGKMEISQMELPIINPDFKKVFENIKTEKIDLKEFEESNDSIFFNSFYNETKEIYLSNSIVRNKIFKGNFVLRSKDSLRIEKNTILEDVILIAPKVTIEEGFVGNVQIFATRGIELEQNVSLKYPSVVCVYNKRNRDDELFKIKIKKECKITGAVVLFGNSNEKIEQNSIEIDEKCKLTGSVYCSGKLMLKSNVNGSVYTNRFFYKTTSSTYDNLLVDVEIDVKKIPKFFISIPLFENKNTNYGILKKVL